MQLDKNIKSLSAHGEAREIRKRIVEKLRYLEDLDKLEEKYDDDEGRWSQIASEYYEIYDIVDANYQEKIESMIINARREGVSPQEYFQKIENKMLNEEEKIAGFFTLEKYAQIRIFDLETPAIDFIKKNALNSECYEFLQILENGKQKDYKRTA